MVELWFVLGRALGRCVGLTWPVRFALRDRTAGHATLLLSPCKRSIGDKDIKDYQRFYTYCYSTSINLTQGSLFPLQSFRAELEHVHTKNLYVERGFALDKTQNFGTATDPSHQ